MTPDMLLLGGVAYVILLLSLTMHEAAHAWAALRGGDSTAYQGGQVSLDPRPHIRREPLGMVFAPLLFWVLGGWMIGWASTPFDPRWAFAHPRRAAAMAAAGPLANLFLLSVAGIGLRLGVATEYFLPVPSGFFELAMAPEGGTAAAVVIVLSFTFSLNLLLFVFNLIPVPPLDGSSAIGLLLSDDAGRRLQQFMAQPMLAWGGILVAWFLMGRIFAVRGRGPLRGPLAALDDLRITSIEVDSLTLDAQQGERDRRDAIPRLGASSGVGLRLATLSRMAPSKLPEMDLA